MRAFAAVNLTLRFVLELCALAALCFCGATSPYGPVGDVLLAVGAPLVAGTAWGLFASPKAAERGVRAPLRWTVELAVFAAATVALLAAGRPVLGILLLVLYAV